MISFKHQAPAKPAVRPTSQLVSYWADVVPFFSLTLTLTFGLSFAFRIHKEQVKLPGENFA